MTLKPEEPPVAWPVNLSGWFGSAPGIGGERRSYLAGMSSDPSAADWFGDKVKYSPLSNPLAIVSVGELERIEKARRVGTGDKFLCAHDRKHVESAADKE